MDNDRGELSERYKFNDIRGCSYFYGINAATDFLENNELLTIIRAHEAQLDGYKMHKWNETDDFPLVITIFSAPNYCDSYNNKGAVIRFDVVSWSNTRTTCSTSSSSTSPSTPTSSQTSWTSSLGRFLSLERKVTPAYCLVMEIFYSILKPAENDIGDDDLEDEKTIHGKVMPTIIPNPLQKPTTVSSGLSSRASEIQGKIRSVAKILKMQRMLREKSEELIEIKNKNNNKLPQGLLMEGDDGRKQHNQLLLRLKRRNSRI